LGTKGKLLGQIFEDNEGLNFKQSQELQDLYEGGKDAVEAGKF
jgi:hypothetical protein